MAVERLRGRLHLVGKLTGRYGQWATLRQEIAENAPAETIALSTEMVVAVSDPTPSRGITGNLFKIDTKHLAFTPEVDDGLSF